jgi:L-alanine-DL-glutamate epimerase-like enolase superfamily enzyme
VSVAVNATIGAEDRAGASAAALAAARAGYECVKVKVGTGDDAGRIAAVRAAAGPSMALRLDANGAWTVEEAIAAIEALAPAGIELIEEPVHGLTGLARCGARSRCGSRWTKRRPSRARLRRGPPTPSP